MSPTWPLTLPSTVTFDDEAQPDHTFAKWGYLGKGKFQQRESPRVPWRPVGLSQTCMMA